MAESEERIETKKTDINEKPLPSALVMYKTKLKLAATGFCLFVIVAIFIVKDAKTLFFLAMPGYLFYKMINIDRQWAKNNIAEIPVICSQIRPGSISDRVLVTFRAVEDSSQTFYQFSIPNKKRSDDFIIEGVYVIYFFRDSPRDLLAYVAV